MAYNETYREDPQVAFNGMVADMSTATIVSRTVTAATGFGKAMIADGEHKARAMFTGDAAADFGGFSIRSQATKAESVNEYPVNDTAGILLRGAIWVEVSANVTANTAVHVDLATGEISGAGGITIPNAKFETDATAGNVAKVRLI